MEIRVRLNRVRQFWRRFKRNKSAVIGLFILLAIGTMALFPRLWTQQDPNQNFFTTIGNKKPPSLEFPMGIDVRGCDVYTEIIYGARNVLIIAIGSMTLATLIGITVGAVAGCTRGIVDESLMGVTSIFLAIPIFPLILIGVRVIRTIALGSIMAAVPDFSMLVIIFFLGVFGWPDIARLARVECLRIMEEEFVEAARCVGTSSWRIILFEVLPNALPSIIVISTIKMAWAITIETQISFLGFSDASIPSWGNLLTLGMSAVQDAPWGVAFPTIIIALAVIAFNVFGDGLNDALNPRLRD